MLIHCRYRRRLQCFSYFIRNKSSLGLWHEELNTDIKLSIEKYWSDEAQHKHEKPTKQTFYVLPMFPYPSGNLHMGHVRVYSISDTVARFHKLCGTNVIHPIGWDAFGLPAENAAIERNILPQEWTQSNIKSMKQQLLQMGFQFDWNREISTCDPNYYKWTQFIFLKLFEEGLAYQSKASVNWDPIDQTVLADEQVDDRGCSWRSGAKVEKKTLTQWFIKTTKFAKRLYDGLDSKSLENWNDIINLQKHWIGECNGMTVSFQISVHDKARHFDVWTSEPHKFIHGEFLTMSRQNIIAQELNEGEKVLICINPITGLEMPVYVADDVDYAEGQNVYIACPRSDENDRQLAGRLNIHVIDHTEDINIEKDNKKAVHLAQEKNVGGHFVSSKLKDWLISRQRYWGTPIPIIHCKNCGTVPVPYEDLPVTLPKTSQKGIQTLSTIDDWVNCKCPKCHSPALRETDTMDTFVDSSWYYYRFLDPHNNQIPFEKTNLNGMTPVHLYIGGKEHAVLHLYYARFMSYFLNSLGWTPTQEPFRRLLVQGMVMGKSYKLKASGKYITGDEVEQVGKQYKEKNTGEPVIVQWEKMSKSKYNGESPERLLSTLGCDTTRLLMLADVPPATSRHWSDSTLPGVLNWQRRLWLSVRDFLQYKSDTSIGNIKDDIFKNHESKIWESRNYYIATGTFHFKYTQKLSVGISRLQGLTNSLRNNIPPEVIAQSREYELALAQLIIMLAPVTPHFCCELWAGIASAPNKICEDINWSDNVLKQKWPKVDNEFPLSFQCKVDGADRCELKVKAIDLAKLDDETALQMMVNEEPVAKKLTRGIQRTKFELYPDSRAILHIFTNRKTQAKEAKVSV